MPNSVKHIIDITHLSSPQHCVDMHGRARPASLEMKFKQCVIKTMVAVDMY